MVTRNDTDQQAQESQLFTLRLWPEDVGGGQTDWRGKVQHVNSGEARYFRDWAALQAFLEELLGGLGSGFAAAPQRARGAAAKHAENAEVLLATEQEEWR